MRKAVRWVLGSATVLVSILLAIYLLRWPLFGGRVRRELERLAREDLKSDLTVGHLGGSLLWGLEVQGVELRPKAGSPIRAGSVGRARVAYGFLGWGPLRVDAENVQVALAPRPGPAPPAAQSAQEALPVLRGLSFEGSLSVRDSALVLPDGRRLDLSEGVLRGSEAEIIFRTEGFGEVRAVTSRSEAGVRSLEARSSAGPVRSLRARLGVRAGSVEPLRMEGDWKGQTFLWEGTLENDGQGRPQRAQGGLEIPQGRARTEIDLGKGLATLDVDGTISLSEPVRAQLELRGRAVGPLEGPLEQWSFSSVVARAKNLEYKSLKIDSAEASSLQGTLSNLPLQATLARGKDELQVQGVARYRGGELELELSGQGQAADVAPYLALLERPPRLSATKVRTEGRLRIAGGTVAFEGSAESAAGAFEGRAWESVRLEGSYSEGKIVARQILLRGTAWGPVVTGSLRLESGRIEAQLEGGPDRLTTRGRMASANDLDLEFSVDGPCRWLKVLEVDLPGWAQPVHAKGRASRADGVIRASFSELTLGEGLGVLPELVAREKEGTWRVEVAPGTVRLPGPRTVEYGPCVLELKGERAGFRDLTLAVTAPAAKAKLSARIERTEAGTEIAADLGELEAWGIRLESLEARAVLSRNADQVSVEVRWGREGGTGFDVSGRLGRESDLRIRLRAPDFKDPFLRNLLGGRAVEGGATADLKVTGTWERPQLAGTLSLKEVTVGGWPPVSLAVALRTEEGILRATAQERTPYGNLAVDGRLTLPTKEARPKLDLGATLITEDFAPLLERLDPVARKWIPPGKAVVAGHLQGPLEAPVGWVEATILTDRFKPPAPLGEARDLRISARLDEAGLRVISAEGRLGGGPFQARGLWEVWKEDRPLRLGVTGEDLLVVDDPEAHLRITPKAALHWTRPRGIWIDGTVEVPVAIYHREFGSPALGSKEKRRAPAPIEARAPRLRLIPLPEGGFRIPGIEGLEAVALDLGFRTTGEFRIENSLLGALLVAEGRLRGTGAVPALSGRVRTVSQHGEVRIGPGSFIHIESSELLLPGEVGKEASARFEGRIGSGQDQITILAAGPPDHASLTLVSDPPKDQRELLAILGQRVALGTLQSELPGFADEWPQADRRESFFSKLAPTVIPGETPGQKRTPWELPALGTSKSTVVRTEYIYNQYFSIIAESDRQAEVSGDVKLRIRF